LDFLQRLLVFKPQRFEGWLFPRPQVHVLWWVRSMELASIDVFFFLSGVINAYLPESKNFPCSLIYWKELRGTPVHTGLSRTFAVPFWGFVVGIIGERLVTSSCTNFRTLITTSLVCEIFPCKGKRCPATRHEGAWGEKMYSSYSFSTSALDEVSGQHHAPAALYPRYPLNRRLVGLRAGLNAEAGTKILCL
jgi:hypothetical protein